MNTFVTITVVSESEEKADKAIENAFSAIEHFGNLVNFFSDKSELASINKNAGIRDVKVSPELLDVIEKSVYVSENSGGSFDATIGSVTKLWEFYKKVKPSEYEIKGKLPLVNFNNIIINSEKSTVFLKKKGMLLDLGGIAKGYAADLAVATLIKDGINAGIVANAGDIRTFGLRPDGSPWKIGIRNPRQKNESDELVARISLTGKAVSTSGDYERFFLLNGKRYHHLIDPKTGHPANYCQSVSVVAEKGVFSDAFSTAVFILGPEKGLNLIKKLGMDAVIIDNNGKIYVTPGIKESVEIERNS